MQKDNPAVYECPKGGAQKLHTWRRRKNGTAYCLKCGIGLTVAQAEDCFRDRDAMHDGWLVESMFNSALGPH